MMSTPSFRRQGNSVLKVRWRLEGGIEEAGDLLVLLVGPVEDPDVLADQLLRPPAEDGLHGVVGEVEDPVVQADDGVGDRIEDRRFERLQLLEAVPGLLLLGDVHGVPEDGRPAAVVDRRHRLQDPLRPAVAGDDPEFVGRKALSLQHPDGVLARRHPVDGMDEAERIHPEHLLLGVAGVFLDVGVGELEFSVLEDVDARLGAVRQGSVEVFVKRACLAHQCIHP